MLNGSRNNGTKTGPGHPPVEHRFKPGNPGRPKGSRNKLSEEFLSALAADFEKHGAKVIAEVRSSRPDQYLRVIAAIVPKQLSMIDDDRSLSEMSDAELMAIASRGALS